MRQQTTPAQVGKDDVAKTGRKQCWVVTRTEPDQVLYFRVRGRRAFKLARIQFDSYGFAILSGRRAFVIAEVMKVGDFHLAQLLAALSPKALFGSLTLFEPAAR